MPNSDLFLLIFNFQRGGLFEIIMSRIATDSIYLVIFGLFIALLMGAQKRSVRLAIIMAGLSGLSAVGFTTLIHMLYRSPRPFIRLGLAPSFVTYDFASFPSGHTAFLAAIAMAVFMKSRLWGGVLFVITLVTGFARIYAGVHWPSDILVGFGLGIIIGYCTVRFGESIIKKIIKTKNLA